MAWLHDLAQIAADVYDDKERSPLPKLPGWVRVDEVFNKWNVDYKCIAANFGLKHFFAGLYIHTITYESVVAFRGTISSSRADLLTDAALALTGWSWYITYAEKFFLACLEFLNKPPSDFSHCSKMPILTGHSLGGFLATKVGLKYPNFQTIVFNAPGLGSVFNKPYVPSTFNSLLNVLGFNKPHQNFHYYNIEDEWIHRVGQQPGEINSVHITNNCTTNIEPQFNKALLTTILPMTAISSKQQLNFVDLNLIVAAKKEVDCIIGEDHSMESVIAGLNENLIDKEFTNVSQV